MNVNDRIQLIALVISIIVIACMTLVFAALYGLYTKYKAKHIVYCHEDEQLKKYLSKKYGTRNGKRVDSFGEWSLAKRKSVIEKERKAVMNGKRLGNILFSVLIAIVVVMLGIMAAFRLQGDQIFIGKRAYLTVLTGSMSEKNPFHPHAQELPNDRLETYSLISVSKVSEADLKLYDVVAFKGNDGNVYIHRIVGIREDESGRRFTTMGDANTASFDFETDFSYDRIIGRYNGYQDPVLGILVIYLRSNIGIITLAFAFLFLLSVGISEDIINRRYDERLRALAEGIPYGASNKGKQPESEKVRTAASTVQVPAPVVEVETCKVTRKPNPESSRFSLLFLLGCAASLFLANAVMDPGKEETVVLAVTTRKRKHRKHH